MIVFFGFIGIVLLYFLYLSNTKEKREDFVRSGQYFNYGEENLLEIYCLFAVLVVKQEKRETKRKFDYLIKFLEFKFPYRKNDVREAFTYSLKYETIELKPACNWLKRQLTLLERIQLIQFICDLSFIDGRLNEKEERLIAEISVLLKVPIEEVRSIVAGLEEAYGRKHQHQSSQKQSSKQKQTSSKPKYSNKRKRMSAILEVPENASFTQVKKSYRRLVKLHHPDRFQNKGEEQIQLAKERFVEIQLAYEYFEKILN